MREKQEWSSQNSTKYNLLNDMPTEVLKGLIRQDCFGSDDEQLDEDTIEMILEIISKREEEKNEVDVQTLWNHFQSEFILSTNANEVDHLPQEKNHPEDVNSTHIKPLRIMRYALIAAALCLLLGNCVAFASGFNLFDYIARWTNETFQFEKIQDSSFHNTSHIEFGDEIVIKGDL